MKRFSHILCFLLAGVIALTAQSAALARTMPDANGQMVICTGKGPMLVHFDANGDPIDAPQICPECVLTLFAAFDGIDLQIAPNGAWFAQDLFGLSVSDAELRLGAPKARGPPVLM